MRKPVLLVLTLAGLFDSLYLLWVYTSPTRPLVCLGSGCDVIRASRYAHLWGHPLPLYGVLMYAALAVAILGQGWIASRAACRLAEMAVAGISAAGFLSSLYLTGLEAFVIHAWCAWCVASAIIVTLTLVLALLDLRREPREFQALESLAARSALRKRLAGALVVVAAAGALAFRYLSHQPELPPVEAVSAATMDERLVHPDSHATGDLSSPVTVVEFGDFECPMCGQTQSLVRQMLDAYGNRIRFVFRQFPLNAIHPYAETAAEASECAAEQGKFWEAERKFYQEQDDLSEPALDRYAQEIGLDMPRFEQCLASGAMAARVRRDLDDGQALGVRSTPTFFVGHQMILGPRQLGELARLIDEQLAAESAATAPSGPKPAAIPPTAAGGSQPKPSLTAGDFGSFGSANQAAGALSSSSNSALACSEDEAKKQQPALVRTPEAEQLLHSQPQPLFVDVRPASEFSQEHLPGAINIPVDRMEGRAASLPRDRTLVLYESGKSGASDICAASRAAGRILLAQGFRHDRVQVYQDGLAGWEKAGLPVTK